MEYIDQIKVELYRWERQVLKESSAFEKYSKALQIKINALYPEVFHQTVTAAIREMTKVVLTGARYATQMPQVEIDLRERDRRAKKVIDTYQKVAMVEGAGTGSGGIIAGMADFPLLLSIKMKMLYELAAIYGVDTRNYKERLYILSIFEIAFSSKEHIREVFQRIKQWDCYKKSIPEDLGDFDWRSFQQEYRDYLDVAKLLQMLPIIGAPVGAYVNHKLVKKLGYTAMQCYRMRWIRYK
ncbi:MAG: EcsC family protein [Cellulosilyticaceae bacterium]